jgi:hypothetical protein
MCKKSQLQVAFYVYDSALNAGLLLTLRFTDAQIIFSFKLSCGMIL